MKYLIPLLTETSKLFVPEFALQMHQRPKDINHAFSALAAVVNIPSLSLIGPYILCRFVSIDSKIYCSTNGLHMEFMAVIW